MTMYRWSDGKTQAWEFHAAAERDFTEAALNHLITARLLTRRRVHDGRTHQYYWLYAALELHMQAGKCLWVPLARLESMRIWDHLPGFIQGPTYDPAAWFASAGRMRARLAQLNGLIDTLSDEIERHNGQNMEG